MSHSTDISHFDPCRLHKIAADLAVEATSIFLADIRKTVGDDVFAKFLNLNSEKSLALVIDVSGSMSGKLIANYLSSQICVHETARLETKVG